MPENTGPFLPRSAWEAANMAAFMVKCEKYGCGADRYEPCNYAQGKFKGQFRRATHGSRRAKGRAAYQAWILHIQQWG